VSNRLHLSKNAFKNYDDLGYVSYFVTVRETDLSWNAKLFDNHVSDTIEGLSEFFTIGKVRSEFAWYDSNFEIDGNWKYAS
jgi:hypothetical protein